MDLPECRLSASSIYDWNLSPAHSMLNTQTAWSPALANTNQYIQVDLGELRQITAVATQGRNNNQWVTSYTISHSSDGTTYIDVPTTFNANTDRNTVAERDVVPTITARYVRLHPLTWNSWPSVRWEIYGCDYSASGMLYRLQLSPAV